MLRFALTPRASLVFTIVAVTFAYSVGMLARLLLAGALAVAFMLVRPQPQRNVAAWRALALKPKKLVVASESDLKTPPVIVVSFAFTSGDAWDHAFSFAAPVFEKSTVLVQEPRTLLPLVRLALFRLGGIIAYSRQALLQLLKKKKLQGPIVVAMPRLTEKDTKVAIANKGAFAAAMKTGALLVPAVVTDSGVTLGKAVSPGASVAVPEAAAVRDLVGEFGKSLAAAFESATGKRLDVAY